VIQVTVREQDGGRRQPVLGQQRIERREHADSRVDDHTRLALGRGEHVAVRPERLRLEALDQHLCGSSPVGVGHRRGRGGGHSVDF
jgi:hypothetical protein